MLSRYPFVEKSRCKKRPQGEQQLKQIISANISTFVSLQAELPPQQQIPIGGIDGFAPYKATADLIAAGAAPAGPFSCDANACEYAAGVAALSAPAACHVEGGEFRCSGCKASIAPRHLVAIMEAVQTEMRNTLHHVFRGTSTRLPARSGLPNRADASAPSLA